MSTPSKVSYVGDGVTKTFSVPFPYLDKTHVKVYWQGVSQAFTWATSSSVTLSFAPTAGTSIVVKRETPVDTPLVTFSDNSVSSDDLNNLAKQAIYSVKEAEDIVSQASPIPLPTTAAELPFTSSVSGFTPASVALGLDSLAGVRIVESGSNANGSYWRWENGLQICSFTGTAVAIDTASGALYCKAVSWTYPKLFSAAPCVQLSCLRTTPNQSVWGAGHYELSESAVSSWLMSTSNLDSAKPIYLAIGKWK